MFVIWTVSFYLCQIIVCKQLKLLRAEEKSVTGPSTLEESTHALISNFQNKYTLNMAWLPLHGGIIDRVFFHMAFLDFF